MRTERHFEHSFLVYDEENELMPIQRELLEKARLAASGAYAPYSNFRVGAAALLSNGLIIQGSNQENAAYPVTMCAERTAIFAAAAQFPQEKIERIAITVITPEQKVKQPVPPCGSCRQAIYESELRYAQPIELILRGEAGQIYIIPSVKILLPLLFDASFL